MRAWVASALSLAFGLLSSPITPMGKANACPTHRPGAVSEIFARTAQQVRCGICFGPPEVCPALVSPNAARFDPLVTFEDGSDKLTQAATDKLDQFVTAVLDPRLNGQKYEFDGFADASGDPLQNLTLSERRAGAVVAYLASHGLDAAALKAKGLGASHPRGASPLGPENRRVEARLQEP